jgi:hypothetical protein
MCEYYQKQPVVALPGCYRLFCIYDKIYCQTTMHTYILIEWENTYLAGLGLICVCRVEGWAWYLFFPGILGSPRVNALVL